MIVAFVMTAWGTRPSTVDRDDASDEPQAATNASVAVARRTPASLDTET